MYLDLDIVKKHLNLESGFTDDDELILLYIDAAEQAVQVHVGESLEDIVAKSGCVPTPILQAMLLQVGNLYQNREIIGTKVQALPFAYQYLINLYRNFNNS